MCAVHASADTRAGNSQGEIKCESAARSSQSWRRGEEEARRFLSLKLSHSDLFYFLFKRKKKKKPSKKSQSRQLFPEVPPAFPDHLTAGFERPRLT